MSNGEVFFFLVVHEHDDTMWAEASEVLPGNIEIQKLNFSYINQNNEPYMFSWTNEKNNQFEFEEVIWQTFYPHWYTFKSLRAT